MKTATVKSYCVSSREPIPVMIEVAIRPGLPSVEVTGNLGKHALEGVKRLETSVRACGYSWPKGKVYVCISPTQQVKEGNSLDLAVAVGILAADKQIRTPLETVYLGEVSLTGEVREFQHAGSILQEVSLQKAECIVPAKIEHVLRGVPGVAYTSLHSIGQLREVAHTSRMQQTPDFRVKLQGSYAIDQVVGHGVGKRVLTISLAGRIPLLLTGPSGVGKTLLAKAAAELLPPMSEEDFMNMSLAYTRAGLAQPQSGVREGIAPSISASPQVLFRKLGVLPGGYSAIAKYSVLFLDELPERGKEVVDSLRQVLETPPLGTSYAQVLIAAQNTCFCGRYGDPRGTCTCSPGDLAKYHRTFSEAIYQRFPLSVYMAAPDEHDRGASGLAIADAIQRVWDCSAYPKLSDEAEKFLIEVACTHQLALRTQTNLHRVSQVIALLNRQASVEVSAVEEALSYRYRPANL